MKLNLFKKRRGVTLVEMLTVVSIIGVLATVGNASYGEVRRLGRDVRRFSDMKQIQTALELYFASHGYYPVDGVPGAGGIVLGGAGMTALDDSHGWTRNPEGIIYTRVTLGNPMPNGIAYVYRSLDASGNDCESSCVSYEIRFGTEGIMADYEPGIHALTPLGILAPEGVKGFASPNTGVVLREGAVLIGRETLGAVGRLSAETRAVLDRPEVQSASTVAAPASIAIPVVGAAVAGGLVAVPQYLVLLFSQPFLLLFRRKRKTWGVAYNSLTKLPEDLAIVRLIDAQNNRIKSSTVTDRQGRFTFLAPPGNYRIETIKTARRFPSSLLSGAVSDGQYADLYFGGIINVGDGDAPHPNIPMDPVEEELSVYKVRRRNILRGAQRLAAFSGPALAASAFASRPEPLYAAILALHILLYLFFRRLSGTRRHPGFGAVYDKETGEAIPKAVLRLYALPYHKLAETRISDANGRYYFLIGPGKFYLTVERDGYIKTETDPIEVNNPNGTTINAPIPMEAA